MLGSISGEWNLARGPELAQSLRSGGVPMIYPRALAVAIAALVVYPGVIAQAQGPHTAGGIMIRQRSRL
jgi:hypothetical protein